MPNPSFGSKINISKTCQNPFYKSFTVVLCKKPQGRIQEFLKGGVVHYWRNLHHQWCWRRVTVPFLLRDLIRGSGAMPPPPQKKCFTFFPLKRHFQHFWDLKSVVKACYKIWSLFLFLSQKPKNNNAWLKRIAVSTMVICRFSTYLRVNQTT